MKRSAALFVFVFALIVAMSNAGATLPSPFPVLLPSGAAFTGVSTSTNYTAHRDELVLTNTTGGPLTVSLPASPTGGMIVAVGDNSGTSATNNVTVSGNGATIDGAANFVIAVNGDAERFAYALGSSPEWKRIALPASFFDPIRGTSFQALRLADFQGELAVSTPTGTGFAHVTGGTYDAAARAVNLASSDVTGTLALGNEASPTGTGLAKVSGGAWSAAASTLVDADVSSSAAIAGTKVSPAFGSQNVSTSGTLASGSQTVTGSVSASTFLATGASPATAGAIRLSNATAIEAENAGATSPMSLVSTDASNNLLVGNDPNLISIFIGTNASAQPQTADTYVGGTNATFLYGGSSVLVSVTQSGVTLLDQNGNTQRWTWTASLNADATTTNTTATNTNLAFQMGASEVWSFRADLIVQSSGTNGLKFAVSTPTSATFLAVAYGMGSSGTTWTSTPLTTSGTLGAAVFCGIATTNCPITITGRVKGDGSHSGAVTIQFAEVTSGTATIKSAGSGIEAWQALAL